MEEQLYPKRGKTQGTEEVHWDPKKGKNLVPQERVPGKSRPGGGGWSVY